MTNSEKIRQFDDEQLARFLWIWKINSVTTFLTQGGMNSMDAKDMRAWLDQTTDTFICTETFVGDDYIFDQDFKDKQADTPQTDCETCSHYKLACELFSEVCKYEPTTQTETQNSNLTFDTPQTESTGSPIGDYRDGVGAWQTDRMTEEEFDTKLAKVLVGQTDCGWGEPRNE